MLVGNVLTGATQASRHMSLRSEEFGQDFFMFLSVWRMLFFSLYTVYIQMLEGASVEYVLPQHCPHLCCANRASLASVRGCLRFMFACTWDHCIYTISQ